MAAARLLLAALPVTAVAHAHKAAIVVVRVLQEVMEEARALRAVTVEAHALLIVVAVVTPVVVVALQEVQAVVAVVAEAEDKHHNAIYY